ncbi:MAG TPA: hypothetical protein VGO16_03115 [Pseudonocardiaceae bacterium]|nr:hypothetical protein [Pseudonocardiaceae bacterium]
MFDTSLVDGAPVAGVPVDEDWFDPAWLDEAARLDEAHGLEQPAGAVGGLGAGTVWAGRRF